MSHKKKRNIIPEWLQASVEGTTDITTIRQQAQQANSQWLALQHAILPSNSIRVLERICTEINSKRASTEMLRLDRVLSADDKKALQFALRKIGGTEDILSGDFPDELGEFQQHIRHLLTLPPEHPESIESRMRQDDFDALATYNLDWLVTHHFGNLSEAHTQDILDRIIVHINSERGTEEKLSLSENFLSRKDQKDLLHARNKLGAIDDIFANPDRLVEFQKHMDRACSLPREHPESIESILAGDESIAIQFLEYLPRGGE